MQNAFAAANLTTSSAAFTSVDPGRLNNYMDRGGVWNGTTEVSNVGDTFTLRIANTATGAVGTDSAFNLQDIIVTVDAGFNLAANTLTINNVVGGSCPDISVGNAQQTGAQITLNIGNNENVEPGCIYELSFGLTTTNTVAAGGHQVDYTISYTDDGGAPVNVPVTQNIAVNAGGLSITKTTAATSAISGGTITYNITVNSTGSGGLFDVRLNDVLSTDLSGLVFTVLNPPPPPGAVGPGANDYTFEYLAAGEAVSLTVEATVNTVNSCPLLDNNASLSERTGTASDSVGPVNVQYDFQFTSALPTSVVSHITLASFCEFCGDGTVTLRVQNPTGAPLTNITITEDLQLSGLTYIPDSTVTTSGSENNPTIVGSVLTWTPAELSALGSLAGGTSFDITFGVRRLDEGLITANRNIIATADFDMSCLTARQSVDTGQFEVPIRQPLPNVIKAGRNYDAGQGGYSDPVYGSFNDDVIWRVNVQNTGPANMQALIMNDAIDGNFSINYICRTEADAVVIASNNGVDPGTTCIAMTSSLNVADPFGNAADPDDITAYTNNAFIYYVGRILAAHTNNTNTADVSWGCAVDSPAGGLITTPASTNGITPAVTFADTGTLSTLVTPANLDVNITVSGSDPLQPLQPLGSKGLVTIELANNTGGSVKNIIVRDVLPAGYVMDNTYGPANGQAFGQPTAVFTSAYGGTAAGYPGFIDTVTRDDPELTTIDPLDDLQPTFTLTSETTTGTNPVQQVNLLRHGDRVSITFGIVMIEPDLNNYTHYDLMADIDVLQENTVDGTDPVNSLSLNNRVFVDFDSVKNTGLQPANYPQVLNFNSDPEDLDVQMSAPLYIVTNDPVNPVSLSVDVTNNGGHDAADYFVYLSFGEAMTIVTPDLACSLTTNPPPRAVWDLPSGIPLGPPPAVVYECTGPPIAPGNTLTLTFTATQNLTPASDDLTFRADVIGEITLADGTPLTFPPPLTTSTTPSTQIDNAVNNYTLDSVRSRVLGFNLTKIVPGNCSEDNPPPPALAVLNSHIMIGEECTYHIESGGWFGFQTPGFALIEVNSVVVTDDFLGSQGYISHNFTLTGNITTPVVNGGAGSTPLQNTDITWAFNLPGQGIVVRDELFQVDITTRLLNDPVDTVAAPNIHAATSTDIARTSFNAVFEDVAGNRVTIPVDDDQNIPPGYPVETLRRVNQTVIEPNLIVTKQVCNETLNGVGKNCNSGVFADSIKDGDANDSYIYRITLTNEVTAPVRSPAYNIISTDTLGSGVSDLMRIVSFVSDGLDNDGDGAVDEADEDALFNSIPNNTVGDGIAAVITVTEFFNARLSQVNSGETVRFYYRVDPDDSIAPLQTLVNSVSMSYDSLDGDYGNQTSPKLNNSTTGANAIGRARIYSSPQEQASVQVLPIVAEPKTIIALSNTAAGGLPQAVVVGEEIRYELVTSLPYAKLRDFIVRDELPSGITCTKALDINLEAAPYSAAGFYPGTTISGPVNPVCNGTEVVWNFGDQELTALSTPGARFSFPLNFVARVENTVGTNEADVIRNGGGSQPGGTNVTVSYKDETGGLVTKFFDPVDVVVREPKIDLTKEFSNLSGDAGDILTVTVKATNTGTATNNNVAAYNLRVLDNLLGSKLTYVGNVSGTDPPDNIDTTTLGPDQPIFSWNASNPDYAITPGEVKTFTFNVRVDIDAQPLEALSNVIQATWSSLPNKNKALINSGAGPIGDDGTSLGLRNGLLPNARGTLNDYETTAAASTSVPPLDIIKTDLDPAIIPAIGAHKHFQIKILLPEGTTNNLLLADNLNAGNPSYVLSNNAAFDITYSFPGIASINNAALSEASFNSFPADNTSGTATWNIGTVVTLSEDDIVVSNITPSIIIDYYARADNILPEANVGDSLQNSATVDYLSGATNLPAIQLQDDTLPVTVVEPVNLVATKLYLANITNPGVAPDIGDVLEYRITVTNNDVAEAFDVNIVDNLPTELLLDTSFAVTALIDGVAATGFNPVPSGAPAGPLIWGRANADNSLDIPPGGSLVLTYRAVVQVISPASIVINNTVFVDWTSLDGDSIYERTGAGCPAITPPNDYCLGPIVAMVAVVEPDLTLQKRVAIPTVRFGTGIPYTLVLENIGTGTAYGATVVDKLPREADNTPLIGGTCDVEPDNFVVRITDAVDESIELRELKERVDYIVSYTAQPSCELIIQTLSAQSGVVAGEKLIIDYDAYLDSGSESGAALSNIAGVEKWFSQDISGGSSGALEFTRTITDGTPGDIDHQDTATVTVEAPTITVQKTVENVTAIQNPGTDASPSDVLRYTITVAVPATSLLDATGVVVTDLIPANASYIADSVTLNGLPVGQPDGGVSPLIAGVDVSSQTPPLPTAGNGTILIGESATLTFDVILDPVITSGTIIQNQAIVNTPATGDLLSDDPNIGGVTDPTETLITSAPAFLVQKTSQDISGDPAVLLPGDTLRYTLTVKNIGQENAISSLLTDQIPSNTSYVANSTRLNGVVVADPAAGISPLAAGMSINAPENTTAGFLRADTNPAANNVATVTFDVVISASAVNGTLISNQGFFSGAGAGSGVFPQQPSDDPGTALVDDPTVDVVGNVPVVDALKTVSILIDNGSIGVVDPGDTLRYTITTTNIGALPATNVVLTDAVPVNTSYVANSTTLNTLAVPDAGAGVSPLVAGIAMSSSDLTPPLPGAGNGVLSPSNSATVTFDVIVNVGTAPGTIISNQGFIASNELPTEPTDADGNGANGNQPTVVVVGNVQQLAITKQVFVIGGGAAEAGKQLEYVVRVTNIGIDATNVFISDDMDLPVAAQKTYVTGSGLLDGLTAGVNFTGGSMLTATIGSMPAAAVAELRFRVTLSASLSIGDTIINSADVTWDAGSKTISASVSIDIGGIPGSANLNGQVWHDADFSNDVGVGEALLPDYRVVLYRNNTQLATTVTDSNGVFFFSGLPPNLPTGDVYELRFLAPGASTTTASLGTTNSAFTDGAQRISNIFAASGTNVQNLNLPRQPNGVVYDSVLRVPVAGVRLSMINQTRSNQSVPARCFTDPIHASQVTQANGYYKFDLNFSDAARCAAGDEYEIQLLPPSADFTGTTSLIIPPVEAVTGPAQNVPNCPGTAADKIPATALHCENSDSDLPPPASIAPRTTGTDYYLKFQFNAADFTGQIYNNHIPVDGILEAAVAISKVASKLNVTRSDLVPYTITFNNTLGVPLFDVSIIDNFPAGFKYVTDSARVDGVAIEPQVNGRLLTWSNLRVDINESRVIKLLLIVGSGVGEGEYVNTARAIDSFTNQDVSGVASATVRVIPDPTFDCSDVIGKVFDDKNLNTYQDQGERGIPGVQVATARGLRVTTDAHGRFHITCAIVANEVRGSNFILKLDERTLPSGYRLTTENPRVQRATRGKMLKFNFGTAIHRVVRLDLADGVFEKGKTTLRPQWRSRIELLITELQKEGSILRLSYLAENETEDEVDDRLDAIEELVSDRWAELDCCYKLVIEKEVFWRKGSPNAGREFE